ncbi:MAG TPA: hypothetical protein VMV69_01215 [Pirellulales bacterium]|nr:hypothetical protein [Pirellulales bacterium]
MEFTRNHYFLAGVVVLLLGIQLRMVDSFVLNENSTRLMTTQSSSGVGGRPIFASIAAPHKVLRPPEWLGWSLMSVGSVLILHSLAMKGPGMDH